jgi:CRISPR-associated protein Csd2
MSNPIENRYDFVLLFEVKDGNPNGDPDAGNLPRLDAETGHGLVTDVCIKRKIRNFVGITKGLTEPYDIYVKEKAVLGRAHFAAFETLGIKLGEETSVAVPTELVDALEELELPEGIDKDTDEEGSTILKVSAVLDKKEAQKWLKDAGLAKSMKDFFGRVLKDVKPRKPTAQESEAGRAQMCKIFFDIRTFGAVLSLKTAPNCGQVRGPVQLTFARSISPVIALEHSITRMAVATEAEAEKQGGDNRTMGRKHTIPYGLYRAHGFISAHLARQTGFSEEDLNLLWQSLSQMFDHDRSAARGEMATQGLYIFKHVGTDSDGDQRKQQAMLGCAPAHKLFELIKVGQQDKDRPPRSFTDYCPVQAPPAGALQEFPGVELIVAVG